MQTVALLPALRRVGFRLSLRWDWRGAGLRAAGPFAAWILGYVVTNQVGYAVIVNLATAAGRAQGPGGSGYSPYTFAFILFSLPYAVVSVSVITALFPRMSRDAVEADNAAVAEATAGGLNLSAVLLVPSTVALVALGPLLATVVFAHGNVGLSGARLIGGTLAGFGVGLVPFSAFQIQLRAWLAMRDARTPFLVNATITAVNVAADVLLYLVLPPRAKVVGLAVGFSLSYAVGTLVFAALLRRRIGRSRRDVGRTHARLAVAASRRGHPDVRRRAAAHRRARARRRGRVRRLRRGRADRGRRCSSAAPSGSGSPSSPSCAGWCSDASARANRDQPSGSRTPPLSPTSDGREDT